jgi:hypothetical protein
VTPLRAVVDVVGRPRRSWTAVNGQAEPHGDEAGGQHLRIEEGRLGDGACPFPLYPGSVKKIMHVCGS